MKIPVSASRAAAQRQLLATAMLTVLSTGAALVGPRAFAQTADQPADGGAIPLPAIEVAGAAGTNAGESGAGSEAQFNTTPESLYQTPLGQVETTVPSSRMENTKAFSVFDVLRESPGIDVKQGNGPRDVGVSIRGSNAQNTFGIRNIVVFEDGFPVTQPDGLSRTDLTDPHAYGAINVIRGPSSVLYGNFATGGALNFQLRTGAQIGGVEAGVDAGSFNYLNNYFAYGGAGKDYDVSIFGSNVIGNGPTNFNLFNTQTLNALASYSPTPDDKITLKLIGNRLLGYLPLRLTLAQFYQNPFQNNCYAFPNATIANDYFGCATNSLFKNGFSPAGGTLAATAWQGGFNRHDTRQILGARWEHNFDINTVWRTQVVVDDKNISQPTGATTARGDEPAINVITGVTSHGNFFGFDAVHFAGIYFNRDSNTNKTYNVVPGGNGQIGALTQVTPTTTTDAGIHGREEIKFTDSLSGVAGLAWEYSNLAGSADNFNFSNAGIPSLSSTSASANNNYYNLAPEGALVFRPEPDWVIKARVATGYGTPQVSNLFVTPNGTAGNNTQLKSQTNLGFDLSTTWTPVDTVKLTVNGFYEFFRNELVSQSPGPSPLMTFTFNAPRSEHRGVEVLGEWLFYPGWKVRVAYTYDNQIYTDYVEQLSAGTKTNMFDRAGHFIPGVPPNLLTARIGYDVPTGFAKGLGAYAEYFLTDAFYADNANLLKIPGYRIVNVNLHYDADIPDSFFKKVSAYVEVRNVLNNTYVASANNVSDLLDQKTLAEKPGYVLAAGNGASSGTIYAGFPRTIVGGLRVRF